MGMNKVLLSRHDIVIRKFFPFRNISSYHQIVKFIKLRIRGGMKIYESSLIKEIYNFVNVTKNVHSTRMQMLKV